MLRGQSQFRYTVARGHLQPTGTCLPPCGCLRALRGPDAGVREGATQAYAYTGACLLAGRGGLAAGCGGEGLGVALRRRGGAIAGLGGALWRGVGVGLTG